MNHILSMLKKRRKHLSFHTPGHKIGKWDITELSFSDNLSSPTGVLKRAEDDITKCLKSRRSFLLTDGSTSGVLSMLYAVKPKRLFLPRESHKSAYNGCKLLGITPILWEGEWKEGLPPLAKREDVERVIDRIDAVFLTSPDYYGRIPDLEGISSLCKEHGLPLLIDGAHGSHLCGTPLYAGKYADYWVDGVHKSLPALTQGAVVSTNLNEEALKEAVGIFRTTSPSYPIMASVEYAIKASPNEKVRRYAKKLAKAYGIANDDWTKLVVPFGRAAEAAQSWLEAHNIYPEFCDGNYIEFYCSDCNKLRELKRLEKALRRLGVGRATEAIPHEKGEKGEKTELVSYREAIGRTVAGEVGLFPPCIPLVSDGEILKKEDAERLERAKNTFGTEDGKVYVYKR